ncbi:putative ABC transporter permease [Indibacter alkaliphilus LW1]|uniref:ABC transporter permease n=1 Tax=Indibacter alkaliphilus (strain CCUG 57479 / KCTC 22604 / LW1) TaxID=1189612 RepID=S2DLL4_INDAL|nr:ABC transporter permease [Indibacter alkaliphilus]EOZ92846.1 putative ABC transporter permease [Indibacter alkaliphilus LW1]
MLKSTLKSTIRSFVKNKTVSLINILGLGVGLATCIFLLLFIWDESSYDKHHEHLGQIYRVGVDFGEGRSASSPAPMAEGFKSNFPDVVQSTRLFKYPMLESMLLTSEKGEETKIFEEQNGYYVDSTFFDVFTYNLVAGNPSSLLESPNTMVLSKTLSEKIYGMEDPIGEVLKIGLPEGDFEYRVAGVFEDKFLKSHINANFFLSIMNSDIGTYVAQENSWKNNNMFHTYIRVQSGTESQGLEAKLNEFYQQKQGDDIHAVGISSSLFLQDLKNIYLNSNLNYEVGATGNMTILYIFGSIGVLILLIACINFMNLSTAKSEKRAKEVGVRKVIGADKQQLVYQFLGESLIMSFISLTLAVLLIILLLPIFNNITDKSLSIFEYQEVLLIILGLTVFTGLISGLYPAFYLSGFKPISILKGTKTKGYSAIAIRKGLVVFQFVVSVALIAMVLVVQKQMWFMQDTSLGFDKEQQLVLSLQSQEARGNYEALKNSLVSHQGIIAVSGGSTYPGIEVIQDWLLYEEGKTVDDVVDVIIGRAADDYIETLGMELIYGRSFNADFPESNRHLIVNQATLKAYGIAEEEAVGKKLVMEWQGEKFEYEVVGVIRDFHFESLHKVIKPFAFVPTQNPPYLVAKIQGGQMTEVLSFIENAWKSTNPSTPFSYSFLDQDFQRNYEKEKRTSTIILYFTIVAILISCIGLFGLAAFTAEQKTKEIGIRKVLGASTFDITTLVSREFLFLVGIAIFIAAPMGYYAAAEWLEGFAYRIELSWSTFIFSGFIAILIAYGTISYQAIRAALMNPVNSLRSQ